MTKKSNSTESTKSKSSNSVLDRIWQGAAAFILLALASAKVYEYVKAPGYMGYALVGLIMMFVLYLLIAPQFRR